MNKIFRIRVKIHKLDLRIKQIKHKKKKKMQEREIMPENTKI